MERTFDSKVYLEVWVKVKGGWADDVRMLRELAGLKFFIREGSENCFNHKGRKGTQRKAIP
jgi:hypothetical protein